MSKTRIKAALASISRDEVEAIVNEIALAENNRRVAAAAMDEEILAVRERYAPELEECGQFIKEKSAVVQAWAEAHPEEFEKRKSVVFPAGTVGFRTGTPKAKTLSGFTWDRVLEKLLALPWGRDFVRVTEEVDKAELIAAHQQSRLSPQELREAGVRVAQDESFFIEPDLTAVQNRVKEAA